MSNVYSVVLRVLRIYEDVINIDKNVLVQDKYEDLVHEIHENHRGVRQIEGHHPELKVAILKVECCFWYIHDPVSHLMISRPEVSL